MLRQEGKIKTTKITSQKRRDDIWGKFLTVRGEYTDIYCTIKKNCLLIRRFHKTCPMLYSCGFSRKCTIVDVCCLPFQDGSDGVVIAVNDDESIENFLAYYSIKIAKIVKKISVRGKMSKLAPVLDGTKKDEISCLHENLKNASQLIAVGTYGGSCYLIDFGIDIPNVTDTAIKNPPFSSDICKTYIDDGRFYFKTKDGSTVLKNTVLEVDCSALIQSIQINASENKLQLSASFSFNLSQSKITKDKIHVTAITYLDRCRTVVIGFSFGAFIIVNLLTAYDALYYHSSCPVYSFACQEPTDDPRPVLYLWVAYSNKRQRDPHAILFVINFPNDEGQPSSQWTFSEFLIMNYLVWYPENCLKWHSFRTVVSRYSIERISRSSNNISERSSSTDDTFSRLNRTDTSRVLMTWKTTSNTIEGALFDLNAFYYKRLPREVIFDDSLLKQNPFIALFTLPWSSDQQLYFDCLVNYLGVRQYQSPYSETDDVFIFASSHSFEIIALNSHQEFTIAIPSLQKAVLTWLDENFEDAVGPKSEIACTYLGAVGLAKVSADHSLSSLSENVSKEVPNEVSMVVSSLLFNGESNDTLKRHIIICPNYDNVYQIAKLIWQEVISAKQKFDELSEPWFDRIPRAISAANMSWLRSSAAVFQRASELFAEILKRVPSERITEATVFNYNMMASRNLVFYAKILFLFHQGKLLPCKNYTVIAARMKVSLGERKKHLASEKKLYITNMIEEMQNACPNETFWCDLTASDWYPPNSIWALLSVTLAMKITDISKHKLIGYFLLDYDSIMKTKIFDRFKWLFTFKDQSVCSQIELKWKEDCGIKESVFKREGNAFDSEEMEHVSEVDRLMKRLLLSNKEIQFIKDSLLRRPDGIRQWNQFCLKRKMFSRLMSPKHPKNGILTDRCDRWAVKIMKNFPPISEDITLSHNILPIAQNSASGGKILKKRTKQRVAGHPYLSPIRPFNESCALFETPQRPSNTSDLKGSNKIDEVISSRCNSPVYDRRISNYERILPTEDLENVHRLLQTPTPRHHRVPPGILTVDPYASPTTQQLPPVPLPTSILKTRKERQEGDMFTDELLHSKNIRFDLPNSSLSEQESTAAILSQAADVEGIEMVDEHSFDTLDSNFAVVMNTSNEAAVESHFEQQEEPEDSVDISETINQFSDVVPKETALEVSFEEQSDSDIIDSQEVYESTVKYHSEIDESKSLPSNNEIAIVKLTYPKDSETSKFKRDVSYEEQEDTDFIITDEPTATIIETEQEIQKIPDISRDVQITSTTASVSSKEWSVVEKNVEMQESKKDQDPSINKETLTLSESLLTGVRMKNISVEEEDENDPTPTEIELAAVSSPETETVITTRGSEELETVEAKEAIIPTLQSRKTSGRHDASGSISTPMCTIRTRAASEIRDTGNAVRGDQCPPSKTKKRFSPSPERRRRRASSVRNREQRTLLCRSPAVCEIASRETLSKTSNFMLFSETAPKPLGRSASSSSGRRRRHASTPERRSSRRRAASGSDETRIAAATSPLVNELNPRKRKTSGISRVEIHASTRTRSSPTRTRSSLSSSSSESTVSRSSSKPTRGKPLLSGDRSTKSPETTPKRLTRSASALKTKEQQPPSPTRKSPRRLTSSDTTAMQTRVQPASSKIKSTPKKNLLSEVSTKSGESTPKRSARLALSCKDTSSKKSLRSRTQSEQTEVGQAHAKIYISRQKRAASEDTQNVQTKRKSPSRSTKKKNRVPSEKDEGETAKVRTPFRVHPSDSSDSSGSELSTASHPMLTRSATKSKKQQSSSRFEPSLENISELPKKRSRLHEKRKTIADVLEDRKK